MALSLLQRVATKALDTLGGAASSAINYLSKNAPHVIDQTLAANPLTHVFSTQGQNEVANVGRALQQVPDTTYHPPTPVIRTPQSIIGDKITELATSVPGQYAQSVGRTLERVATPSGRQKLIHGAMQLPSQVAHLDVPGVVNNPAVEDALNASDLFTLGAGTAAKIAGKDALKVGTEQILKTGAKDVVKQAVNQDIQGSAKTLFKQATTGAPGVISKTADILNKSGDVANRDLAMKFLNKTRPAIGGVGQVAKTDAELALEALQNTRKGAGQAAGDVAQATGEVLQPSQKTADLFQKGTDIARKWINTREGYTQWRAGDIKKNPALTQFDHEGLNAIIDLQSGKNAARYQPIQNFTDGLFQLEKKAGILNPDQYRQHYLPQLWDNTPEQIQQVFNSKNIGGAPGFSKSRILEDYKTGIDAGLTPRHNTISDLLTSRFSTAQKSLADKQLVDTLVQTGNAKTLDKAPMGWQTVDLKHNGQALAVDPETAKMIRNYTTEGSPLLKKTAEFVSGAKQTILSAGVPKTGWNFHTGVNIPVRAAAIRKNPFGAVIDSVIWNTNPKSALHYVENVVPKDITDGLLKEGLTISRSSEGGGYAFKPSEGKSLIKRAQTGFDKLFSEAAFDKVLPAHKLKVGWETYQNALKNGATQQEAYRIGANTANTVFGGVNPAEMSRSKDFQNVMRTFLLAPDWLESNVRVAKNTGALLNPKNWSKPEFAPYKRFATNAAAMYTTFAMTNKGLSGHWPWENGPGQEFNLATGSFDDRGRQRMVSAFGTAFDFARIPLGVISSIAGNDPKQAINIIKNRLSPPVSSALALGSNQDYRGREIVSPNKSGVSNAMGIAGQVGNAVGVPSQITNTIALLRGQATPEEWTGNILEAPLRYNGGANTQEKVGTANMLKQGGASNQDINKALSTSTGASQGGGIADLFGGGAKDYSTLGSDSTGAIKMPKSKKEKAAFDKSVDTALSGGSTTLPDNAIVTRFFNGQTYDKSARKGQQDILNSMLKVADDPYLAPEQKAKIANAAKISQADLQYYRTASLDQTQRLEGLLTMASSADPAKRDELVQNLMLGKKEVGGKAMFSTSMYDRLYDEGLISKSEKALIAAVKYDPIFNKFYMDRDYKGTGSAGGGGGASTLTPAKAKAYVSSINALHRKTIPNTGNNAKQVQQLLTPEQAPKINFGAPTRSSAPAGGRWFRSY